MIASLLRSLFGICLHSHPALPMCGWQRCLQCGEKRKYTNRDKTLGVPGPWMRDIQLRAERQGK